MFPREHGAYGQLLFPLITVLASGHPLQGYGAAAALSVAAVFVFLAHEPALIVLGQRGARVRRESGRRAFYWLAVFGALGIAFGVLGLALADRKAARWLVAPIALGIALTLLIAARREHTTEGELVSAAAFSSLAVPIGVAAHVPFDAALTCAVAFWSAFAAATLAVRATIFWKRHPLGIWTRIGAVAFAAGAAALTWWLADQRLPDATGRWAALPVCALAAAVGAVAPEPARIRTVGWLLVGATGLMAALLVAGMR